jgi:predicted DCC family thiol-disulfide oxidoreductase YuxK
MKEVKAEIIGRHLILYDGKCGLCHKAVAWIVCRDPREDFVFAPLNGSTHKGLEKRLPRNAILKNETMILLENWRSQAPDVRTEGSAALRIAWLLGGGYRMIGWLSFLPGGLYNWAYRAIARRRAFFPAASCPIPARLPSQRFLP